MYLESGVAEEEGNHVWATAARDGHAGGTVQPNLIVPSPLVAKECIHL